MGLIYLSDYQSLVSDATMLRTYFKNYQFQGEIFAMTPLVDDFYLAMEQITIHIPNKTLQKVAGKYSSHNNTKHNGNKNNNDNNDNNNNEKGKNKINIYTTTNNNNNKQNTNNSHKNENKHGYDSDNENDEIFQYWDEFM